ncbi:prolipoprotein diacylglyceryl transferase [Candidatus Berkiella aquae]|uniref:Phosphatidylglycerol--prolipoprotein diacylglyceryl transferase n=1 Tax=Candidatus Berkiella aquae TaxID=295108 RepID=A0A0Q9Z142_9GAMM|nr:prolipoprotein diacylglyceryl transferase [Candidatus Berkiella aquae]MCS5712551.1 prolipoprotein diacylglyceryl transferase [Candidatus Berkiella aquae]
MIEYPNINPVALHITDAFQIRWYGIMYLVGFVACWLAARIRTKSLPGWESPERLNDLLFYTAMGVVLGGRIGYMLFYAMPDWLEDPLQLFKIWQGGMSFHGGLLGVIISTALFARHQQYPFWVIGDIIAPTVPLAIATGRLGNFINGELWGKVTDVPWAMVFPQAGFLPRHPFPLYAIALEGGLLFMLVWLYSSKQRHVGAVSGIFLLGYGVIRIFEEFFRQPDPQYGYFAFGWLTMGQILCLPMILFGLYLLLKPRQQPYEFCKV